MLCLGFKFNDKACHLDNGKYNVIYDEQFSHYPNFEFEVNGRTLTKVNSNKKEEYIIKNLSERSFQLIPSQKQTNNLPELQKALISNGQPYYEITNCRKDTIEFIMRVNLHITSHSGKFVRIR
jgi:hypothetical protein